MASAKKPETAVAKYKPRNPLEDTERCAIAALSRCKPPKGSWDKSFIRSMNTKRVDKLGITARQRDCLWVLVFRYREQIIAQDILVGYMMRSGAGRYVPYSLMSHSDWRTRSNELVKIAVSYNDRVGLRRRVAALRREGMSETLE